MNEPFVFVIVFVAAVPLLLFVVCCCHKIESTSAGKPWAPLLHVRYRTVRRVFHFIPVFWGGKRNFRGHEHRLTDGMKSQLQQQQKERRGEK